MKEVLPRKKCFELTNEEVYEAIESYIGKIIHSYPNLSDYEINSFAISEFNGRAIVTLCKKEDTKLPMKGLASGFNESDSKQDAAEVVERDKTTDVELRHTRIIAQLDAVPEGAVFTFHIKGFVKAEAILLKRHGKHYVFSLVSEKWIPIPLANPGSYVILDWRDYKRQASALVMVDGLPVGIAHDFGKDGGPVEPPVPTSSASDYLKAKGQQIQNDVAPIPTTLQDGRSAPGA